MYYEDVIEEYLELFDLEEILEQSDLTALEVLTILFVSGHLELPPYLEEKLYDAKETESLR